MLNFRISFEKARCSETDIKDKLDNRPDKKINQVIHLEIYIEEDGKLILVPLTDKTLSVLKAISADSKNLPSVYCG